MKASSIECDDWIELYNYLMLLSAEFKCAAPWPKTRVPTFTLFFLFKKKEKLRFFPLSMFYTTCRPHRPSEIIIENSLNLLCVTSNCAADCFTIKFLTIAVFQNLNIKQKLRFVRVLLWFLLLNIQEVLWGRSLSTHTQSPLSTVRSL